MDEHPLRCEYTNRDTFMYLWQKTILVNREIKLWSATTLSIMTFRTMTLCTKDLNVILIIITLSMCNTQHNNALPLC